MKLLWLTETPSNYDSGTHSYNGRGWIGSLQKLVENADIISEFGIVFPHEKDSEVTKNNTLTYFPIKRIMPKGFFSWVKMNWENKIEYKREISDLNSIIQDFKPDIIHIFGTESWLCHAIFLTNIPCVVHIQGLLAPIANTYYPNGVNSLSVIRYDFISFLKGSSIWHYRRVLLEKKKREQIIFQNVKYLMGRTDWDKDLSIFLSPNATYFHVDEVLRNSFYSKFDYVAKKGKLVFTSTLSNSPYKGLDVIIKTAILLKKTRNVDFEWNIIGISEHFNFSKYMKLKNKIDYKDININLLGVLEEAEIIEKLIQSTFYIHTSYIENSPNSVCEAQIIGVPVISTNVGGISSLIENGKTGFLVPANDPYFLAATIVRLKNQTDLLEQISTNSRQVALHRHSKERILKQLMSTYTTILNGNTQKINSI